jgi:hypothetical protein
MAFGDFTVTRASTKNVLGSAGLYVSVANNVPAFEFNANGTYRGLLVEPGATNLALRSQELGDAVWTDNGGGVIVTSNATTAPDGTTTAEAILANTANSAHFVQQRNLSVTSGTAYTWSVFLKRNGYRYVAVSLEVNVTASTVTLDFDTGLATGGSGMMVQTLPDGWYRLSATTTATNTASTRFSIRLRDDSDNATFIGDDTKGVFAWQAQLELGSVATSPIVTTAGTASRVADVVSLTGASSLIGQDSGWIGVSLESGLQAGVARPFARLTNDASATILDGVIISKSSTDQIQLIIRANNAEIGRKESEINQSGKLGIVIRYDETGSTSLHVNGATISTILTTAFTFANTISVISLGTTQNGTAQLNGHMRAYTQGATAMTEAQANALSLSLSTL